MGYGGYCPDKQYPITEKEVGVNRDRMSLFDTGLAGVAHTRSDGVDGA